MGQNSFENYTDIGIELQQYPTGFLYGIKTELGFKTHHAITVRLGYNSLDHQDFGIHDSEIGGGFGGTIGYRYYFNPSNYKLFLGLRSDLWFNQLDWEDLENGITTSGKTSVTVLQPTAIIGYNFMLKEHFIISPTLGFGAEINIITDGAPVGQGAIFLWGFNALYRF